MKERDNAGPESDASLSGSAGTSYSFTRMSRGEMPKFELTALDLGIRFAIQDERQKERLHTQYPNHRLEMDYSKFRMCARPSKASTEPMIYNTGIGIDHCSGIITGLTVTPVPTSVSTIRLYKSCVLPPTLWLPPSLSERYADDFDSAGIPRVIAIDNGKDFTSDATADVLCAHGSVLLQMPPARGDLKGKVERTLQTLESKYISNYDGYFDNKHPFTDRRHQKKRKEAFLNASMTVDEYFEKLLLACIDFNYCDHPDLKLPRMQVYREGLRFAPPILLAGRSQIDSTFALTFEVTVSSQGVLANNWQYQSDELKAFNRVVGLKGILKIPVDDVRWAYLYLRELTSPIRVKLETHFFRDPTPYELAVAVVGNRAEIAAPDSATADDYQHRHFSLQTTNKPLRGVKKHVEKAARGQAAAQPPVDPPRPAKRSADDIRQMFRGPEGL